MQTVQPSHACLDLTVWRIGDRTRPWSLVATASRSLGPDEMKSLACLRSATRLRSIDNHYVVSVLIYLSKAPSFGASLRS